MSVVSYQMHIRFSTVIGLPVIEDAGDEEIALISGILLNPDLGKVEGFFVRVSGFLHSQELFLPVADIAHWGNKVRVQDAGALSPLEEFVRLKSLHEEGRPVLHQRIVTEGGMHLGVCRDVQFDTISFYLEWIFPRRWWRWRVPLPASSIVVVRSDAVVVRDAVTLPEVTESPSMLRTLDPLGTSTAAPRVADRQ